MKKLLLSLVALLSGMGVWAQREVIKGITTMPTTPTAPASITTGYYLLKEVNPSMTKGNGGFLKAEYEIPTAAVRPIGRDTELTAEAVDATHIWYIIEETEGTYSIASANKFAAWQEPSTGRKDLVDYASKASFSFVTEAFTLGNQTTTPADGAFVITKTDGSACFHCEGNFLASWTDGNPGSVAVFEAYQIDAANLVMGDPEIPVVGQKFRLKTKTGLNLVYSAVPGKGFEGQPTVTAGGAFPNISDEGVYSEWALIEDAGNKYLYNVDKKEFLTYNGGFKFCATDPAVFTTVDKGSGAWNIVFGGTNMHVSTGYGIGKELLTGWEDADNSKFYLLPTGEAVSDDVQAEIAERLTELGVWKYNAISTLGYVGCYEKTDETKAEIEAITNVAQKDAFVASHNTISLSEGYYYIKGTGTGNSSSWYVTYNAENKLWALNESLSVKHAWKFEAVDGDGYKLQSCNLGKYAYLVAAAGTSSVDADQYNGHKFVFTDNGEGKFTIKNGDGSVMRTEAGGDINYWGGENNETWYLIAATDLSVDVTIGDAGYATAYLPYDVTLPTGLEAYAVTAAAGESAILTQVDDIKGHEGVILKGDAKTYTLKVGAATSDFSSNLLEGSIFDAYVNGGYVLSNGTSGVGLYKAALNKNEAGENGTTHFKNNAGKAYLPASAVAAGTRYFLFDFGNATGIESIEGAENANGNAAIYDLSGRRVQKAQKGIFIINGKKVIK